MAARFVDTNVLLYAVSADSAERAKAERANASLAAGEVVLSVQVLQEFYVQATRASRDDALTHDQAARLVESFRRFAIVDLTVAIVTRAIAARDRFQLSYWDAAIIESARAGNCAVVLTEDLNDGEDFAGVQVENPFAARRRVSAGT